MQRTVLVKEFAIRTIFSRHRTKEPKAARSSLRSTLDICQSRYQALHVAAFKSTKPYSCESRSPSTKCYLPERSNSLRISNREIKTVRKESLELIKLFVRHRTFCSHRNANDCKKGLRIWFLSWALSIDYNINTISYPLLVSPHQSHAPAFYVVVQPRSR